MHHERLRMAREGRGWSVDELTRRTGIRPRTIDLIERGAFAELPAGLYCRSSIRAYASAVGLDPEEILEDLRALLPVPEDALDGLARLRGHARRPDAKSHETIVASAPAYSVARVAPKPAVAPAASELVETHPAAPAPAPMSPDLPPVAVGPAAPDPAVALTQAFAFDPDDTVADATLHRSVDVLPSPALSLRDMQAAADAAMMDPADTALTFDPGIAATDATDWNLAAGGATLALDGAAGEAPGWPLDDGGAGVEPGLWVPEEGKWSLEPESGQPAAPAWEPAPDGGEAAAEVGHRARWPRAVAASAIDGVLLAVLGGVLVWLTALACGTSVASALRIAGPAMALVFAVIAGLYFVIFGGLGTCTLGAHLMRLDAPAPAGRTTLNAREVFGRARSSLTLAIR